MSDHDLTHAEQRAIKGLLEFNTEGDLYALLGVSPDAERREIREAFYECSRQWHPDRFFQRELGEFEESVETLFVAITNAYRILTNKTTRAEYDRSQRAKKKSGTKDTRQAPRAVNTAPTGQSHDIQFPQRNRPQVTLAESDEDEVGLPPITEQPVLTTSRPAPRQRPERKRQRKKRLTPAMRQLRKQMNQRVKQAREYYEQGREDFETGEVLKAVSALHLATRFDPKNREYKRLFQQARKESRKIQATGFVTAAENAESFAKPREAIANYRKAVEYGTDDSRPYYRLGLLVRRVEEDPRSALQFMRKAVQLDSNNIDYRLSLGNLYAELGLGLNARREFEAILKLDRNHPEAKEGLKRVR